MDVVLLLAVLVIHGPVGAVADSPGVFARSSAAPTLIALQDSAPRRVLGRVTSDRSGAPLPYALVEMGTGTGYRAAATDSTGRYVLRDVAAGRQRLRVTTLDHEPFEIVVEVPGSGDLQLDLALRLEQRCTLLV